MPRIVDLSIYLENDVLSDPPLLAPKIEYRKHRDTLSEFMKLIPGTKEDDYPDREAAAAEWVHATTHSGTHLDAPWHYHSTMDARFGDPKPSITIDQVPLEWCFKPGVKLDFRDRPDGYVCTPADVEAELARIGHALEPLDIVLVNTRAGSRYGHDDYRQRRLRHGARRDDVSAGARRAGDGHRRLELGRAVLYTAKKFAETGDTRAALGRAQGGREIGYCHLEKLHNLESLPGDGFTVCCFPAKIRGASAGWTRAVAIFDR